MAHPRQAIREKVTELLLAGATAAEDRVFPSRMDTYVEGELPAIAVYTLEESVDADSRQTAPRQLRRTLQLAIVGAEMVNEGLDNTLDTIAADIERVMDQHPTLGGLVADSILASTEIGVDEQARRPVGKVGLVYTVLYDTDAPAAADQPLDDLNTVDSQTNLGGAQDPRDQAEDVVRLGPAITAFTLPAASESLTVAIESLTVVGDVSGYMLSESSTPPGPGDASWEAAAPASFTFGTPGAKALFAWVKSSAGQVAGARATVTISEPPP